MYTLQFPISESRSKINHKNQILLLGSCFSDEIHQKFRFEAFSAESNPVGTIFHPLMLSRFLIDTLKTSTEERTFKRDDVFLSWDAGSGTYAMNELDLTTKLQLIRADWQHKLKTANYLLVTFGSAWGYHLNDTGELVANCHKMPSKLFIKNIATKDQILLEWKETIAALQKINPSLQFVFTVSPVRHVKDGLIENNLSKAVLIETVSELSKLSGCSYFPSYEIVIDELRDYRFFEKDLVHPNQLAIQYVWDRFKDAWMTPETKEVCKEVENVRLSEGHKPLHPESIATQLLREKIQQRKSNLAQQYPELAW